MMTSKPVLRGRLSDWFRRIALATLGLAGLAALNIAGCPKPQFTQMIRERDCRSRLSTFTMTIPSTPKARPEP